MDPDANLAEQRALAGEILERDDADTTLRPADAERLAELVLALDGWLAQKGRLPDRWDARSRSAA